MKRLSLFMVAILGFVACGGSDSNPSADDTSAPTEATASSSTASEPPADTPPVTEPPTTTIDPVTLANTYAEAGPHPVGVTTTQLAAGNQVEIWYPAVDGTTGNESYDVRDFVPDAIRNLLTADVPAVYEYEAGRDAEVAAGAFPVVLFSHGYSGMRLQSTFLTAHLASWGMVVVSADHWSRDLFHVLSAPVGDRSSSISELSEALDLVITANSTVGGPFEGRIDDTRVVAVGHSAGGGTIVGAALADDRIDGYVSLASGVGVGGNTTTTAPLQLPSQPSFFIAGALDGVISAETGTRASYDLVPGPSRLWIIDGVGHNGFDDFCTFGNGSGIIGVAIASGLGALLEAQPTLKTLGEDGCLPPSVPVAETFPIIRHAVTAQIRYWFGEDAEPIGLGPESGDAYSVSVDISSKD